MLYSLGTLVLQFWLLAALAWFLVLLPCSYFAMLGMTGACLHART